MYSASFFFFGWVGGGGTLALFFPVEAKKIAVDILAKKHRFGVQSGFESIQRGFEYVTPEPTSALAGLTYLSQPQVVQQLHLRR